MTDENVQEEVDVMFCLPGNNFSGKFLDSWNNLMWYCIAKGISFGVSRGESPSLPHVRNMCLSGNFQREGEGRDQQLPFVGTPYKYMMWIDSDIIFTPHQFQQLLDKNVPVVSGLYMMAGKTGYACVPELDDDYYKVYGHYKFLTPKDIEKDVYHSDDKGLIPIAYSGLGFTLIKQGVIEKLPYPWFRLGLENKYDLSFEDFYMFKKLRQKKVRCYADTTCIVGHEKKMVI